MPSFSGFPLTFLQTHDVIWRDFQTSYSRTLPTLRA